MKIISLRLPAWMLDAIQKIVNHGLYADRSEFIREAIRNHIRRYKEILDRPLPEPIDGLVLHNVQIKVPQIVLEVLKKRRISLTRLAVEEVIRALLDGDNLSDEEAEKLLQALRVIKQI